MNMMIVTSTTMTSREIAEITGKNHSDVMRDIRNMLEALEKDASSFADIYLDVYKREQPCFRLPYDETICLLTGYEPKARMAVIKRWQDLENGAAPKFSIPTTLSGALRLAADQAEIIEKQSLALEAAQPAIQMVERYVEAKSSKCLSDVAKILNWKPQAFIAKLADDGVIFKRSGSWVPYQHHIDVGRFTVKTGESNGHAFHQARVEPSGIEWLAKRYGKETV